MSISNINNTTNSVGPAKHTISVDISTSDFADYRGFLVQANSAGDLKYLSLGNFSNEDTALQTETGMTNGQFLKVQDVDGDVTVPIICRKVSATSTVTSITVVYL